VAIANVLQLEAARRHAVPIRFNFVACAKFEVAQPILCPLRVFLLLLHYVMLWPWTLTRDRDLDLWPWTSLVYRLCHGQTLYQIWVQSSNMRRSYCSLNIWPYDLEHVRYMGHHVINLCTKFKRDRSVRCWVMDD